MSLESGINSMFFQNFGQNTMNQPFYFSNTETSSHNYEKSDFLKEISKKENYESTNNRPAFKKVTNLKGKKLISKSDNKIKKTIKKWRKLVSNCKSSEKIPNDYMKTNGSDNQGTNNNEEKSSHEVMQKIDAATKFKNLKKRKRWLSRNKLLEKLKSAKLKDAKMKKNKDIGPALANFSDLSEQLLAIEITDSKPDINKFDNNLQSSQGQHSIHKNDKPDQIKPVKKKCDIRKISVKNILRVNKEKRKKYGILKKDLSKTKVSCLSTKSKINKSDEKKKVIIKDGNVRVLWLKEKNVSKRKNRCQIFSQGAHNFRKIISNKSFKLNPFESVKNHLMSLQNKKI